MTDRTGQPETRYRLTVNVIIRRHDGRILLLKRSSRSRIHPGRWDLPGGKTEACEDFHGTLCREVLEETGLGITLTGLAGASELTIDGLPVVFLVMGGELRSGEVRLSNEHDEFLWTEPDQALSMDLCEQFRDVVQDYSLRMSASHEKIEDRNPRMTASS